MSKKITKRRRYIMKVLMLNGSPRTNGNTFIALEEMKKGIENSEESNYNNFNALIRESKENNDTITEKEYSQENEGGNEYGTDISSKRGIICFLTT